MLSDMQLWALKPGERIYKVADQQGLYAAVTPSGAVSFRYDYRVNDRRETLVIGRYDPRLPTRQPREADGLCRDKDRETNEIDMRSTAYIARS